MTPTTPAPASVEATLLPCPHCGGPAKHLYDRTGCPKCLTYSFGFGSTSTDTWNRRAPSPPPAGEPQAGGEPSEAIRKIEECRDHVRFQSKINAANEPMRKHLNAWANGMQQALNILRSVEPCVPFDDPPIPSSDAPAMRVEPGTKIEVQSINWIEEAAAEMADAVAHEGQKDADYEEDQRMFSEIIRRHCPHEKPPAAQPEAGEPGDRKYKRCPYCKSEANRIDQINCVECDRAIDHICEHSNDEEKCPQCKGETPWITTVTVEQDGGRTVMVVRLPIASQKVVVEFSDGDRFEATWDGVHFQTGIDDYGYDRIARWRPAPPASAEELPEFVRAAFRWWTDGMGVRTLEITEPALAKLFRFPHSPPEHGDCRLVVQMWPISVQEAQLYQICRICGGPDTAPFTLNYGKEYAHTKCLTEARAQT